MRIAKRKGFRFLTTGLLLLVLMLVGCPMPDTDMGSEMQGEYQEETDARAALMTGTVKQVACGSEMGNPHSMIVKSDGTLWATGDNSEGQLGLGNTNNQTIFMKVPNMSSVKAVACGEIHTMAVSGSSNTLYATGYNGSGQLGTGNTTTRNSFVRATDNYGRYMTNVIAIACGYSHSLALKSDGTLWAAGSNANGQLGTGTQDNIDRLRFVKVMSNVKALACGMGHSVALKTDGTLWAAGWNKWGQIGNGDHDDDMHDPDVYSFIQMQDENGTPMSSIKSVACGNYISMAIKNDGTLWVTGGNFFGQLGTGDGFHRDLFVQVLSNVKTIAGGGHHSLAVLNDGTLMVTGDNMIGQLGLGDYRFHPEIIEIYSFTPAPIQNVKAVAGGFMYSLAIKNDGTLWVTGTSPGLGNGDERTVYYFEKKIALRSYNNMMYVCADTSRDPSAPLYSESSSIGKNETFGLIDLGNGNVALRAHATGGYVCAENAGTSRAVANREDILEWETFSLYNFTPTIVAFKAVQINNKYLRFDSFMPEQDDPAPRVYFYTINVQ